MAGVVGPQPLLGPGRAVVTRGRALATVLQGPNGEGVLFAHYPEQERRTGDPHPGLFYAGGDRPDALDGEVNVGDHEVPAPPLQELTALQPYDAFAVVARGDRLSGDQGELVAEYPIPNRSRTTKRS